MDDINKFHTIHTKNKKHDYRYFIFFDTETMSIKDKDNEILTLKLGCAKYWDRELNKTEDIIFYKPKDFWQWVFKKSKDKEIVIYAYNTDVDFKIVKGLHFLLAFGYEPLNCWLETTFILKFKKGKTVINIWDVGNYFKKDNEAHTTLKKLGEILKLPKLDINFDSCSINELIIYCQRDVEIIFQAIKSLFEFLNVNKLGNIKSTASSLGFNIFTTKFLKEKIVIHSLKNLLEIEKKSYRGGFTDCFKIGNFKQKLYHLDVNSMYPYVMKNNVFPINLSTYSSDKNLFDVLFKAIEDKKSIIAVVNIFLPKDKAFILSKCEVNKEDKTCRLSGQYWATLTTPELNYVLKYGKILMIDSIAVYDNAYIFSEFIDFFYKKRLEYLEQNNLIFSEFCKLIMNSVYGKFGQRKYEYTKVNTSKTFKINSLNNFIIDNNGEVLEQKIYQFGYNIYVIKLTEDMSFNSFIPIPSHVTAYARDYLTELIEIAEIDNVYYTDTDSLIVNEKGYKNLEKFMGKGLGQIKLVGISNYTEIINPKHYTFNDITKIKGIKINAKKIIETDKGVAFKQKKWQRFKTDLKSGNSGKQIIKNEIKVVSKKYKKGKVIDNDVFPFEVKNKDINKEIKIRC